MRIVLVIGIAYMANLPLFLAASLLTQQREPAMKELQLPRGPLSVTQ